MATRTIDLLIKASYQGSAAFKKAEGDAKALGKSAVEFGDKFKKTASNIGTALLPVGAALGAVALASKVAWDSLNKGAELELARSRFDNLAESINTTGDALLGKLKQATNGMMSDAALIASASDLMSLGLAKTEEQAVRMASVIGQLGWDMQQVVLTMANNSTMRLDALGLSMEDVKARAKALEAAGHSMDEAFDLAVIEAGEAKLGLLGSAADTTAGKIQQLTTMAENAGNAFSVAFSESLVTQIESVSNATESIGPGLESAAGGAGALAGSFAAIMATGLLTNPTFLQLMKMGFNIQAENEAVTQVREMAQGLDDSLAAWGKVVKQTERAADAAGDYSDILIDIPPILDEMGMAAWGDIVKGANMAAGAARIMGGELQTAGKGFDALTDAASENFDAIREEARQAAEEAAQAWEEYAGRVSGAFGEAITALQDIEVPDLFGEDSAANMDAVSTAIYNAGVNAGGAAGQLSELGVATGQFTPQMAEAALKAALFAGALEILSKEWKVGNLNTADFIASVNEVVTTLETNTVIELQAKAAAGGGFQEPVRVPVKPEFIDGDPVGPGNIAPIRVPVTLADDALSTAISAIDSIPDDSRTIELIADSALVTDEITVLATAIKDMDSQVIFSEPDAETVYAEIDAIETGIDDIDGTVTMEPETAAVWREINSINGKRINVYVDFVPVGAPSGGGGGGNTAQGGGNKSTNMVINFNGPAEPRAVTRAVRNSMAQFYADVAREGVSW